MSTLIVSSSAHGSRRRCNAKCYNARRPECDCICGGANHGVGECQARQNTRDLGATWLESAKRLGLVRRRKFVVPQEQGDLFSALGAADESGI